MVVIALDTNFVTPRIIHGGKRSIQDINLLDRLSPDLPLKLLP